ncbi:DUF1127 domain-containing protein [Rhodobacter capsulatus]|uniref:DUF1127 domain-containing protein n=1 Tax=Rhodobacter capsulatus TaxID=1061 RepID=UPI0040269BF5
MSQPHSPPFPVEAPASCPPVQVRNRGRLRPFHVLALWRRRAQTRARLAQLGAEALCDIGLTEAERRAECGLWFWRGTDR